MKYRVYIKITDLDTRREAAYTTEPIEADEIPLRDLKALIRDLLKALNQQPHRDAPAKPIPVTAPPNPTAVTRQSQLDPIPKGTARPEQSKIPKFDDLNWISYEKKNGVSTKRPAKPDESGWSYADDPKNDSLFKYIETGKDIVRMNGSIFEVRLVGDGHLISRRHLKE